MDHLRDVERLKNYYLGLRHGQSVANREGRIVSDPTTGAAAYGLTPEGRAQVRAAVQGRVDLDADVLIVSSDFARCRESAEVARELLGAAPVVLEPRLRERDFGDWEGSSTENYPSVWDRDAVDPAHQIEGVESVTSVLARTTALVRDLEERWSGRTLLVVSHGDPLQILATSFLRWGPERHRDMERWAPGEVRELDLRRER